MVPEGSVRPARSRLSEVDVAPVTDVLRRMATTRVRCREDLDDLVQEAIARLWQVRERVERDAAVGYGIAIVKNLVISSERARRLDAQHTARMLDLSRDDSPDEAVLRSEERAALRTALARVSPTDRDLLLAHEVHQVPVRRLAASCATNTATVSARLAGARARLRVEFVLVRRKVELPTPACRSVLVAISLGDRCRQQSLHADAHLAQCPVCASLKPPLSKRSRALVALVAAPVVVIDAIETCLHVL